MNPREQRRKIVCRFARLTGLHFLPGDVHKDPFRGGRRRASSSSLGFPKNGQYRVSRLDGCSTSLRLQVPGTCKRNTCQGDD